MTPEQIATLAGTLGVPSILAIWMLRWLTQSLNGKLDRLTSAVEKNTEATQHLSGRLKT